jgi:hypothetical protein
MNMSPLLAILGVALLLLGWKLFWLFVGVVGFTVGLQAAPWIFGPQPLWMLWAAGLICGLIGTVLALFFQHVAIAVGGFVAGITIAFRLMLMLGHDPGAGILLAGGVLGAVALYLLFDWALIVLSSMVGAIFILEALGWQIPYAPVLLAATIAAGVVFQVRLLIASRQAGR